MKKRILLLNDRLAGGGAEQVLQLVAADLASDAKTALRAGFEDTGFLEWLTDELTVRIN